MAIQSNGKILVTGETWPNFAALARLNVNGTLDSSFGQGGFAIDRRLPPLRAVALQPNDRILVGGVRGFQLARYLSDGTPDPDFGGGDVAGTLDPEQPDFIYEDYGPEAIVVRPQGEILVGGTQQTGHLHLPRAIVRLYNTDGSFAETIGEVPQFESHLGGLVLEADGSLIGAGSTYAYPQGSSILLAKFLPGSGTNYDPAFGGGEGLVRPAVPPQSESSTSGHGIAQDGEKLLVAGTANDTFLLARFGHDGTLDPSFGEGGFADPIIAGQIKGFGGSPEFGSSGSWANDVAVFDDGRAVVVGSTSRWGRWRVRKGIGPECTKCPQPMLARFTPNGQLDPTFGNRGLLRLLAPDGGILEGQAEEVVALAAGKTLVEGFVRDGEANGEAGLDTAFLARLNGDGTYDQSFGEGGLVIPRFPCFQKELSVLRREGCIPKALATLHVKRVSARRLSVSLEVKPSFPWARISKVRVSLPKALQPRRDPAGKSGMVAVGVKHGRRFALPDPEITGKGQVIFRRLRLPEALHVTLLPGALRIVGEPLKPRKLAFRLTVEFAHDAMPAGRQTLVLRGRRHLNHSEGDVARLNLARRFRWQALLPTHLINAIRAPALVRRLPTQGSGNTVFVSPRPPGYRVSIPTGIGPNN